MQVKISTALNVLLNAGRQGAVVAKGSPKVLLWTLEDPFRDGRSLKKLREIFPKLEVKGPIILLGRFTSIAEANMAFDRTKRSSSVRVRKLFWFVEPEKLAKIRNWQGRKG